jgi:predicted ATPase
VHVSQIKIDRDSFPPHDGYPFSLEVFRHTRSISLSSPVTFFVGENGSGKSTLLKSIAQRANIHIWKGFDRSRYKKNRYEDQLYRHIRLEWANGLVPGAFFASEIFRNFSQLLDEWASTDPGVLDYFGKASLMTQSHGQGHMAYFEHRFGLKGFYLLDEPENALSPKTQLRLLSVLESGMRSGVAQFVIATHSPILLSLPGARILSFDASPIDEVSYKDTEQYRVYRDFIRNSESG